MARGVVSTCKDRVLEGTCSGGGGVGIRVDGRHLIASEQRVLPEIGSEPISNDPHMFHAVLMQLCNNVLGTWIMLASRNQKILGFTYLGWHHLVHQANACPCPYDHAIWVSCTHPFCKFASQHLDIYTLLIVIHGLYGGYETWHARLRAHWITDGFVNPFHRYRAASPEYLLHDRTP